jgi:putative membrane protein
MTMRHAPTLAAAAAAALLSACSPQGGNEAVDKAQDAVSAPVGQTSAATKGSNLVSAYVPGAAMGDMYEIEAADIALERAKRADV